MRGDTHWMGIILAMAVAGIAGCHTGPEPMPAAMPCQAPRELAKMVLPTYRIEPPDVLAIEASHLVPRAPYHLRAMDVVELQVPGALPDAPINGLYRIQPGGVLKLGFRYGGVPLCGLTADEAEQALQQHLAKMLREPTVNLTVVDIGARQQITGQHLVGPDGTVTLGTYGSVRVVGLTIPEARNVIETYLSSFLENPDVSLDVYGYNSKAYYVIVQGAGTGDGVYRFPVTGNETVLDAISHINGLQTVSSKRIWIARPTENPQVTQMMPVNWEEITAQGLASTNYQVMPGDRVFISEDKLIALDVGLAKITAPIERVMGFTLLGVGTTTRLSGPVLQGGGNKNSNF